MFRITGADRFFKKRIYHDQDERNSKEIDGINIGDDRESAGNPEK